MQPTQLTYPQTESINLNAFRMRCRGAACSDISAGEVAQARAAAQVAVAKGQHLLVSAFPEGLSGLGLVVCALMIAVVVKDLQQGKFILQLMGAFPLAVVLAWGVFAVNRAGRAQWGGRVLSDTNSLATQAGRDCENALMLVTNYEGARAIRDTVVARGEELLVFHFDAMVRVKDTQLSDEAVSLQRKACQTLHGIAPAGSIFSVEV